MPFQSGRHFLHIPGPTQVPERVMRAMHAPTIDHRGSEFSELALEVIAGLERLCQTKASAVIYPASGTGAWEAALVNTLSPGDRVLMCESGFFSDKWRELATRLGLTVEYVAGDWHTGVDETAVAAALEADRGHRIKAVCMVHNETSTGVTSPVPPIRRALDSAQHPALLIVDVISSLGSIDYRHDAWGVDVSVGASQKGLMLVPGLSFNVVSEKAIAAAKTASLPRSYWDWSEMLSRTGTGFFPYTPATNLLFGLREALAMLEEEGMVEVFSRHRRLAEAARRAVSAWGLEIACRDENRHSQALTTIMLPTGHDEKVLRGEIERRFDMSLGIGLGRFKGRALRLGHLGALNELMLAGALCGIEMGLKIAGVPYQEGGVGAALTFLSEHAEETVARPREVISV